MDMEKRWKKIIAERAHDVVGARELTGPSAALLTDEISLEDFIMALLAAGQRMDAVKVLAYALPRREAVWWACMCAREMAGVVGNEAQQRALAAAEKWVYEPTAEHRTAAYLSVQKCKSSSGGMLCALAASFSEEVLPVGGDQKIDVDINTFPGLIFAVIVLAADEGEEDLMDQRLQVYLSIGQDIACGGSGKLDARAESSSADDQQIS